VCLPKFADLESFSTEGAFFHLVVKPIHAAAQRRSPRQNNQMSFKEGFLHCSNDVASGDFKSRIIASRGSIRLSYEPILEHSPPLMYDHCT